MKDLWIRARWGLPQFRAFVVCLSGRGMVFGQKTLQKVTPAAFLRGHLLRCGVWYTRLQ